MYLYRPGPNRFKSFSDASKISSTYALSITEAPSRHPKRLLKHSIPVPLVKKRHFLDDKLVFSFYHSVEVYGNYD